MIPSNMVLSMILRAGSLNSGFLIYKICPKNTSIGLENYLNK
jgi:hypothetical protein